MTLACHHDHSAVGATDHHRLMSCGVPRRRQHRDAREHLYVALDDCVAQAWSVDEFGKGVVGTVRQFQLDRLDHDRSTGKKRVTSAVIEVQVAVDHDSHVFGAAASYPERGGQRATTGSIVVIDLRMTPHARVDEQDAVWVVDQVTQAGLDAVGSGPSLLGWAYEVAEIDPAKGRLSHRASLSDARSRQRRTRHERVGRPIAYRGTSAAPLLAPTAGG